MQPTIPLEDSFLDQGQRKRMCDDLAKSGITDRRVLEAMMKVPRHWFVERSFHGTAYKDQAMPIACEQTISRPSTVAMQSQLLSLERGMKVLEIGTGSGYQTAVLCAMGGNVYTIERQHGLFHKTKRLLRDLGYNVHCYLGDGYKGLTEVDYGPFDRVIITCGAPYIPVPLMQQLKHSGVMVIPVGDEQQEMLRITKNGEEQADWEIEKYGNFPFVPMLDGKQFRNRRTQ